jgi:hypothetical protein
VIAALLLLVARMRRSLPAAIGIAAVSLAIASLLAAPSTWAAYSVTNGTSNATIPTAGPSAQISMGRGGFGGGPGGFMGSSRVHTSGSGSIGAPPSGAPQMGGAPGGGNQGSPANGGNGRPTASGGAPGSAPAGGFSRGGNPGGGGGFGGQMDTALIRYLEAHQGSALYLVATASANEGSSIIISTGKAVMALGGFSGNDNILTTAQLAKLVAGGTVHYFLVQAGGMGGNSALMQWVEAHGTVVPASEYGASSSQAVSGGGQGTTVYYVSSSAAAK